MRSLLVLLALISAGCERGPPVPSAAENRELDEAERMLDEAPNSLANIDENGLEPR